MEVDDLMQEVAVKFISKLETLREVSAFRPWLRPFTMGGKNSQGFRDFLMKLGEK